MRFATALLSGGAAASLLVMQACSALLDAGSLTDGVRGGAGGDMGGASSTAGDGGGGTSGMGGDSPSTAGGGSSGVAGSEVVLGGSGGSGGSIESGGAAGASDCVPTGSTEYCDGVDNDCDTQTPDDCAAGCTGTVFEGASYMLCTGKRAFDGAEADCVAQDMHLARINGPKQNTFVLGLLKSPVDAAWLGGSDQIMNRTFEWRDGFVFYADGASVKGGYDNFAPGQPVNTPNLDCVQIGRGGSTSGQWRNAQCTETQPFVCERY